jgi:hypothetical protein
MNRTLLSVLFCWWLAAPIAVAQFVEFQPPPGWIEKNVKGARYFSPPGVTRSAECVLIFSVPFALEERFDQMFLGRIARALAGAQPVDGGSMIYRRDPAGVTEIFTSTIISDQTGTRTGGMLAYAADVNGTIQFVTYRTESEERFYKHLEEVRQCLATMKFPTATPDSRRAAPEERLEPFEIPTPNNLGVIDGLHAMAHPTGAIKSDADPEKQWIFFQPDGRFYMGYPPTGFLDVDWDQLLLDHPDRAGTYVGNRDQAVATLGNREIQIRIGNGTIDFGGQTYTRLSRCNGLELLGGYMLDGYERPGDPVITFEQNGRFLESGRMGFHGPVPEGSKIHPMRGGRGNYRVVDNTLVLKYPGNRTETYQFHVLPMDMAMKRPDQIVVNGKILKLQR